MPLTPIKLSRPRDIYAFYLRLRSKNIITFEQKDNRLTVSANLAAMAKHFIIASDGYTYLTDDVKTAPSASEVTFKTKEGTELNIVTVKEMLITQPDLPTLFHNKPLAEMLINANPTPGKLLNFIPPVCPITKSRVIFPLITPYEDTLEDFALHQWLKLHAIHPTCATPLTTDLVLPNHALQELLLIHLKQLYQRRQAALEKLSSNISIPLKKELEKDIRLINDAITKEMSELNEILAMHKLNLDQQYAEYLLLLAKRPKLRGKSIAELDALIAQHDWLKKDKSISNWLTGLGMAAFLGFIVAGLMYIVTDIPELPGLMLMGGGALALMVVVCCRVYQTRCFASLEAKTYEMQKDLYSLKSHLNNLNQYTQTEEKIKQIDCVQNKLAEYAIALQATQVNANKIDETLPSTATILSGIIIVPNNRSENSEDISERTSLLNNVRNQRTVNYSQFERQDDHVNKRWWERLFKPSKPGISSSASNEDKFDEKLQRMSV